MGKRSALLDRGCDFIVGFGRDGLICRRTGLLEHNKCGIMSMNIFGFDDSPKNVSKLLLP